MHPLQHLFGIIRILWLLILVKYSFHKGICKLYLGAKYSLPAASCLMYGLQTVSFYFKVVKNVQKSNVTQSRNVEISNLYSECGSVC